MIDYNFIPETLDWCKRHYVPPIKEHIHCPDFGNVDWMNGSCHWCHEMCAYQCQMCMDESWIRGLISDAARIKSPTREAAIEFIEDYKQKRVR